MHLLAQSRTGARGTDERGLYKMNWAQKAITGVFLSVALMAPVVASAVPLSVYESASSEPAKQIKIFNDAYSTAVSQTVTQLRSSTFADGKVKSAQRLVNDRRLADVVDALAAHATDAQSKALINMIEEYAAAQPNTELEDVISSFLLTEAKK
jgi:maltodextrin utilization protein YvdJ